MDKVKIANGMYKTQSLKVLAGEADLRNYVTGKPHYGQEVEVEKVSIHPNYHNNGQDLILYDLAILKLKESLDIDGNSNIQKVSLPPPYLGIHGREVLVGGWGKQGIGKPGSVVHLSINLTVHSNQKCKETYTENQFFGEQMFCLGGSLGSTCPGDSGGPALMQGSKHPVLIGVLSFGVKGSCGKPSVFQSVER